ncbi:hypothetical protein JCM15831A_03360 [Asaia astilbis]
MEVTSCRQTQANGKKMNYNSDAMESSAKKAVLMEETPNLMSAYLHIESNNMKISLQFKSTPEEVDIESMESMVTYIYSDLWRWIGNINTEWTVLNKGHFEGEGTLIFSRNL